MNVNLFIRMHVNIHEWTLQQEKKTIYIDVVLLSLSSNPKLQYRQSKIQIPCFQACLIPEIAAVANLLPGSELDEVNQ